MPGMWGQAAEDDKFQREQRDALLVPGIYEKRYPGRYMLLDAGPMAEILQQRFGVDTLVQHKGKTIGIQEKIVRWPGYQYECFFLETMSCTIPEHESDGWMKTSKAQYLLYCFQTEDGELDCWLIDLPKLQEWFWPREEDYPSHRMDGEKNPNRSLGRIVPIKDVHRAVPCWPRRVGRPCISRRVR